ncbi:hypothetical protein ABKV83_22760 (plasmid) [Enterobacter asburiae]|uniref:hypothetical protein n=1 Tax=Enterobacter asburiae TaxID=61645 RepID=UPI0032AF2F7C
MKKTLIAAMVFSPLAVNAASVDNVTPQSKTIVITAPNSFSHVLTPVTGLTAGSVSPGTTTDVATGEVKPVSGGAPAQYAVQFASGGNNVAPVGDINAIIKGTSDPTNTLVLLLKPDATMPPGSSTVYVGGTQWLVYPPSTSFKYVVTATNSTIKADSYPVVVNAAVYTP